MARLVFPSDREVRLFSPRRAAVFASAQGLTATVYSDEDGTVLADVQNYDGTANAGATFTVDSNSELPLFLGPADGSDLLYLRVNNPGAPVVEISADTDAASLAAALADVTAALAGKQPLDSDLTAIAALATTAFGRSLLTAADAAAGKTLLEVSGGSPMWTEHDLSDLLASEGTVGTSDTGTWDDASAGVIGQTVDVGVAAIGWQEGIGGAQYVVEVDVKVLAGQDSLTTVVAAFQAGDVVGAASGSGVENVGLGVGIIANEAGDTTDFTLMPVLDGAGNLSADGGPTVTVTTGAWHTIRAEVGSAAQTVYLDGVYKGAVQMSTGGNGWDPNATPPQGPDSVSLFATGLVQFRNMKIWTPALPA